MKRYTLILLLSTTLLSLFLGLTLKSAPAADSPVFDYSQVVVKAYFDSREQVAELASWKEPWSVNYEEGYLIIEVTPAEYDQLVAAGFRLEIDQVLTAELNTPRQPLPGQGGGIPGYPCYRTVEETFTTAEDIVANYPQLGLLQQRRSQELPKPRSISGRRRCPSPCQNSSFRSRLGSSPGEGQWPLCGCNCRRGVPNNARAIQDG
jgi:hypothetical protein